MNGILFQVFIIFIFHYVNFVDCQCNLPSIDTVNKKFMVNYPGPVALNSTVGVDCLNGLVWPNQYTRFVFTCSSTGTWEPDPSTMECGPKNPSITTTGAPVTQPPPDGYCNLPSIDTINSKFIRNYPSQMAVNLTVIVKCLNGLVFPNQRIGIGFACSSTGTWEPDPSTLQCCPVGEYCNSSITTTTSTTLMSTTTLSISKTAPTAAATTKLATTTIKTTTTIKGNAPSTSSTPSITCNLFSLDPAYNYFDKNYSSAIAVGSAIVVNCVNGSVFSDNSVQKNFTCLANGTWTSAAETCAAITSSSSAKTTETTTVAKPTSSGTNSTVSNASSVATTEKQTTTLSTLMPSTITTAKTTSSLSAATTTSTPSVSPISTAKTSLATTAVTSVAATDKTSPIATTDKTSHPSSSTTLPQTNSKTTTKASTTKPTTVQPTSSTVSSTLTSTAQSTLPTSTLTEASTTTKDSTTTTKATTTAKDSTTATKAATSSTASNTTKVATTTAALNTTSVANTTTTPSTTQAATTTSAKTTTTTPNATTTTLKTTTTTQPPPDGSCYLPPIDTINNKFYANYPSQMAVNSSVVVGCLNGLVWPNQYQGFVFTCSSTDTWEPDPSTMECGPKNPSITTTGAPVTQPPPDGYCNLPSIDNINNKFYANYPSQMAVNSSVVVGCLNGLVWPNQYQGFVFTCSSTDTWEPDPSTMECGPKNPSITTTGAPVTQPPPDGYCNLPSIDNINNKFYANYPSQMAVNSSVVVGCLNGLVWPNQYQGFVFTCSSTDTWEPDPSTMECGPKNPSITTTGAPVTQPPPDGYCNLPSIDTINNKFYANYPSQMAVNSSVGVRCLNGLVWPNQSTLFGFKCSSTGTWEPDPSTFQCCPVGEHCNSSITTTTSTTLMSTTMLNITKTAPTAAATTKLATTTIKTSTTTKGNAPTTSSTLSITCNLFSLDPAYNYFNKNYSSAIAIGSAVVVNCINGSVFSDNAVQKNFTCLANGTWTSAAETCAAITSSSSAKTTETTTVAKPTSSGTNSTVSNASSVATTEKQTTTLTTLIPSTVTTAKTTSSLPAGTTTSTPSVSSISTAKTSLATTAVTSVASTDKTSPIATTDKTSTPAQTSASTPSTTHPSSSTTLPQTNSKTTTKASTTKPTTVQPTSSTVTSALTSTAQSTSPTSTSTKTTTTTKDSTTTTKATTTAKDSTTATKAATSFAASNTTTVATTTAALNKTSVANTTTTPSTTQAATTTTSAKTITTAPNATTTTLKTTTTTQPPPDGSCYLPTINTTLSKFMVNYPSPVGVSSTIGVVCLNKLVWQNNYKRFVFTCTETGIWQPDPTNIDCGEYNPLITTTTSTTPEPPAADHCNLPLIDTINMKFMVKYPSPVALNSTVGVDCLNGLVWPNQYTRFVFTCSSTETWEPDPSTMECGPKNPSITTTGAPVTQPPPDGYCNLPSIDTINNKFMVNYPSQMAVNSTVGVDCLNGLVWPNQNTQFNFTCSSTGTWEPDPSTLQCGPVNSSITTTTSTTMMSTTTLNVSKTAPAAAATTKLATTTIKTSTTTKGNAQTSASTTLTTHPSSSTTLPQTSSKTTAEANTTKPTTVQPTSFTVTSTLTSTAQSTSPTSTSTKTSTLQCGPVNSSITTTTSTTLMSTTTLNISKTAPTAAATTKLATTTIKTTTTTKGNAPTTSSTPSITCNLFSLDPAYNYFNKNYSSAIAVGSAIVVNCVNGSVFSDNSVKKNFTCLANGTWTPAAETCAAITSSSSAKTTETTTVAKPTSSGTNSTVSNASSVATAGSCQMFSIDNSTGSFENNYPSLVLSGSSVAVLCKNGTRFPDSTTRAVFTCQNNGTWTPLPAAFKCQAISTSFFQQNYTSPVLANQTVTVVCKTGFMFSDLSSVRIYKCLDNGTWVDDPTVDSCRETVVTCEIPLLNLTNSIQPLSTSAVFYNVSEVGTQIYHICQPSFSFQTGQPLNIYQCLGDGSWSNNLSEYQTCQ